MSAYTLRWADAQTASVWFELRDLAPALAGLIHCPVPDRHLQVVLEWADALALPDAGPALALDRLGEVLPAIVSAFVAAHTYAVAPPSADHGESLEVYDRDGCGRVVGRVLPLVSILAVSLHGDAGERLVAAIHAELLGTLHRLWDMIAGR